MVWVVVAGVCVVLDRVEVVAGTVDVVVKGSVVSAGSFGFLHWHLSQPFAILTLGQFKKHILMSGHLWSDCVSSAAARPCFIVVVSKVVRIVVFLRHWHRSQPLSMRTRWQDRKHVFILGQ